MRYETNVELVKDDLVSDGMGGYDGTDRTSIKSFYAEVTPLQQSKLFRDYGIKFKDAFKLVTKERVENIKDTYIIIDNRKFNILEVLEFRRFTIINVVGAAYET